MSFRARHLVSSLAFAVSLCPAGCSDGGTGPETADPDAHLLFSVPVAVWGF